MSVGGQEAPEPALVEILYFDGCPHHEQTTSRVERVAAELGLRPEIRLVKVADAEAAARQRFLGSPTVRVKGEDVEPGAEKRGDYALSCRVFTMDRGISAQPERWIRDALLRNAGSK
ncbi:MAG: DF family (seleno)protein [Gaiellaceae bacterium]